MTDLGFTHIALTCRNADRTIEFYNSYGGLDVVHDRVDDGVRVFWLGDRLRPFVIVFLETDNPETPLGPFGHLGVAVESRADVDRLCTLARENGVTVKGPNDFGPPVGYWAFFTDPDGHTLEISYGQDVALAVRGDLDT